MNLIGHLAFWSHQQICEHQIRSHTTDGDRTFCFHAQSASLADHSTEQDLTGNVYKCIYSVLARIELWAQQETLLIVATPSLL